MLIKFRNKRSFSIDALLSCLVVVKYLPLFLMFFHLSHRGLASEFKEEDVLSSRDIAKLISDQFEYLNHVIPSIYSKHPKNISKNIFIAYVGDIDIPAIAESLQDRYRGGVKVMDADCGFQQYMYEKQMPLHTYLLSGIPNWIIYSLNWVLRRQSLVINKDPKDLESAIFAAHVQGEKHFDRTVTFLKPELLLEMHGHDFKWTMYVKERLASVIFIYRGSFIRAFHAVFDSKGDPDRNKCGIRASNLEYTTFGNFIFSFIHDINFGPENPFFLMGVDPKKWKENKRQYINPRLPI
ncbi:MAG: hypothetical protein AB8G05_21505 [Oligoflexales bacterium]